MHADVKEFRGETRWLSNFWEIPGGITYRGMHASTTEHIYQACKALYLEDALHILNAPTAGKAKYRGGELAATDDGARIRPDWNSRKLVIMAELTRLKYEEPTLRAKLLELGAALVVEGNHWHDVTFGVCYGSKKCGPHKPAGDNLLGRIIMVERARIIAEETFNARAGE